MSITCCKGTRDILPSEIDSWYYLENIAFRLVENYGYKEIRTPLFESRSLFANCMGRDSSVVKGKLWTFKGQKGEILALRPDFTAATLRAYCDHCLYEIGDTPRKLFYMGPVFLRGGRQGVCWEGHQFGLECIGTGDPLADTEVIMMVHDFCQALKLPQIQVHINTLGCPQCRLGYQQMLSEFFCRHSEDLCPVCRENCKNHPLWVLGCPEGGCRKWADLVPVIHDYLCEDCDNHFHTVCDYLSELKVDYTIDPLVVRDNDYYNRTVFKISCGERYIAFGGRYDGLAGKILGISHPCADVPAVGCAVDIEPLLNILDELQIDVGRFSHSPKVCFAGEGYEAVKLMLPALYALRRNGVATELYHGNLASDPVVVSEQTAARFVLCLRTDAVRQRVVDLCDKDANSVKRLSFTEALALLGREFGVRNLADELRPVDMRQWSIATRTHHSLSEHSRPNLGGSRMRGRERRRLSLKSSGAVDQLLSTSPGREGNRRLKTSGYALSPAVREKVPSGRVRKRRREDEDSLEVRSVSSSHDLPERVYSEPLGVTEDERLGSGRGVQSNRRTSSRGIERSGGMRADRSGLGKVERFVYSSGVRNSYKRSRGIMDSEYACTYLNGRKGCSERSASHQFAPDDLLDEACYGGGTSPYREAYAQRYGGEAYDDLYASRSQRGSEQANILVEMEHWQGYELPRGDSKNIDVTVPVVDGRKKVRHSRCASKEMKNESPGERRENFASDAEFLEAYLAEEPREREVCVSVEDRVHRSTGRGRKQRSGAPITVESGADELNPSRASGTSQQLDELDSEPRCSVSAKIRNRDEADEVIPSVCEAVQSGLNNERQKCALSCGKGRRSSQSRKVEEVTASVLPQKSELDLTVVPASESDDSGGTISVARVSASSVEGTASVKPDKFEAHLPVSVDIVDDGVGIASQQSSTDGNVGSEAIDAKPRGRRTSGKRTSVGRRPTALKRTSKKVAEVAVAVDSSGECG